MILLDTHIWVWWVQGDPRLSPAHRLLLDSTSADRLGVSAFSCWEVTKLHEKGRLVLPEPVGTWLRRAAGYPRLEIVPVSLDVTIAVAELPPGLPADPADQIIVATARVLDAPLLTMDRWLLSYPHVKIHR